MRKTDIREVKIKYANGDEVLYLNVDGFSTEYINHDAGNIKDRQEWDEVEIHLVGEKRPLTVDKDG